MDQTQKKEPAKRKKAVALRYDTERDAAPKLVGKGAGKLAEKLVELAKEHGIPIREDADLTEILSRLELFEEIPPSTYVLVAEILAFVYRANQTYEADR